MPRFPNFGERVLHYMRLKFPDETQEAHAKRLGISGPSLSELKRPDSGSKAPSAHTLLRAAEILGLEPQWLLTEDGPELRRLDQLGADEMRLLLLYRELGHESQHALEVHANDLFNKDHPGKSDRNPFGQAPTSSPNPRRSPGYRLQDDRPGRTRGKRKTAA